MTCQLCWAPGEDMALGFVLGRLFMPSSTLHVMDLQVWTWLFSMCPQSHSLYPRRYHLAPCLPTAILSGCDPSLPCLHLLQLLAVLVILLMVPPLPLGRAGSNSPLVLAPLASPSLGP